MNGENDSCASKVDKKIAKEKALLDAGTALFASNGYLGTTVEDIVKEASVAKGTFYLYFKDKAELCKRIFKTASESQGVEEEKIFALPRAVARLRRYIELRRDFFANNVFLSRITVREIHGLEGEAAKIFFRAAERTTALLGRIIEQGVRSGELACSDPQGCAVALTGLINYYIVWENLNGSANTREAAVEFLLGLTLKGLGAGV